MQSKRYSGNSVRKTIRQGRMKPDVRPPTLKVDSAKWFLWNRNAFHGQLMPVNESPRVSGDDGRK